MYYDTKRKLLSQNFFHSPKLVARIIDLFSLKSHDLVIDIGSGVGIITRELSLRGGQVVAVEIDTELCKKTQLACLGKNVKVFNQDFLKFTLPQISYKVFANIPFAIEGKIIRKLLYADNPPDDCALVLDSSLAKRLASSTNSLFSILHSPWFSFDIMHHFSLFDFTPVPKTKSALFRFTKRQQPVIEGQAKQAYQLFVTRGYADGNYVKKNLSKFYAPETIDRAFQKLSISRKAKPTSLNLTDWVRLFRMMV